MADLLVDTDVFIDHLRGAHALVAGDDRLWYSVVTRCEIFAGAHVDEEGVRLMLSPFTEVPIDRTIAERAGRLRRQHGTRIADALIAATAIIHDLALVTRNTRDFQEIPGLRVQHPR